MLKQESEEENKSQDGVEKYQHQYQNNDKMKVDIRLDLNRQDNGDPHIHRSQDIKSYMRSERSHSQSSR